MSQQEKEDLEEYFRYMLTKSEGGYVLFGVKPICVEGLCRDFPLGKWNIYQSPLATRSERLRRGLLTWTRHFPSNKRDPVQVLHYKIQSSPCNRWQHTIWVNTKILREIIECNLPLFQVSLGPQMTASKIVDAILDEERSLFPSLINNKVLTGILLGFGTDNALFQSRIEEIEEVGFQKEKLPFAKRMTRTKIHPYIEYFQNNGTLHSQTSDSKKELRPNFGYETIEQEYNDLKEKMGNTRKIKPHIPIFAYLYHDPSSERLIKQYQLAQRKIDLLLNSETFFEDVLTLILGYSPNIVVLALNKDEANSSHFNQKELTHNIASSIWSHLLSKENEYVDAAIEGMRAADDVNPIDPHEKVEPILKFFKHLQIEQAKNNLKKSVVAIESEISNHPYISVVKDCIYFNIIQEGSGTVLDRSNCYLSAHFTVSRLDNQDEVFFAGVNNAFAFGDLIPGLILGMDGMREGEIREIIIHPDYAYGYRSNFEQCVALKVRTKLIAIQMDTQNSLNAIEISPVDYCDSLAVNALSKEELHALRRAAGFAEGYNAWSFYRRGNQFYSLNDIVEALKKPVDQETNRLFKFHQKLYQSTRARDLYNSH